jgi:predicted peptidase
MNVVLISAMLILLALIVLPFWLAVPGPSKDRRLIKEIFHPGGRRYTLSIPEGFDNRKPVPLILALHYGGHGLPFYGEIFLTNFVEPVMNPLSAIIVAPDCPSKDWTHPESEEFIIKLLAFIRKKYEIDPQKVVVLGYSMGGNGVWHLASKYPDQFSYAIIMSASPPEVLSDFDWKMPMYIVHGRNDELFPIMDTTKAVIELEKRGIDVNYRILEKTTHYETHKFLQALREVMPQIMERWKIL